MERIDKKIAENHQRQDFLRKRIQSDKEELAKLESEARVLEHSQLAVVFSCEIKDVNSLVTKEHDTLMRLRSQGITDDMLEALANGEISINTNSEEDTNESKVFYFYACSFHACNSKCRRYYRFCR